MEKGGERARPCTARAAGAERWTAVVKSDVQSHRPRAMSPRIADSTSSRARGDERRGCRLRLSRVLRRRLVAFFLLARARRVDLPLASRAPPPRVARLSRPRRPRASSSSRTSAATAGACTSPGARSRAVRPLVGGRPDVLEPPRAVRRPRTPRRRPSRRGADEVILEADACDLLLLAGMGRPRAPTHPPRASQRYPRRRLPRRRVRGAPPRIPRRPRGARRRSRRGRGSHRHRRRGRLRRTAVVRARGGVHHRRGKRRTTGIEPTTRVLRTALFVRRAIGRRGGASRGRSGGRRGDARGERRRRRVSARARGRRRRGTVRDARETRGARAASKRRVGTGGVRVPGGANGR